MAPVRGRDSIDTLQKKELTRRQIMAAAAGALAGTALVSGPSKVARVPEAGVAIPIPPYPVRGSGVGPLGPPPWHAVATNPMAKKTTAILVCCTSPPSRRNPPTLANP